MLVKVINSLYALFDTKGDAMTTTTPTEVPKNPFRPGNGQKPVYLAGRDKEQTQFRNLVRDTTVSQNLIITGLRGVGKTVLLDELKPIAQANGWLWTGNDLSESTSLTEDRIARRIVVDLSTLVGPLFVKREVGTAFGFTATGEITEKAVGFDDFWQLYERTPGLVDDKLKAVLSEARRLLETTGIRGVIFAYDEAQNLSDHALSKEYPLSTILDVFSYFQRTQSKCSFMLALTGLPTLYPKLNEARTYSERMFQTMYLTRLEDVDAREAIIKPIELTNSTLRFSVKTIDKILANSNGYPYFIQFICKEVFDAWIAKMSYGEVPSVNMQSIIVKLDQDFFAPRWARATDRQQDFMKVVATLEHSDEEFSVQEIVTASRNILVKGFTPSHATQILQALAEKGLMYKSRRGGYSFAVPLLNQFIQRQVWNPESIKGPDA
jgi:DNA-binding transcriptional ArsR family regulator